jgi:flagellar hook-length control protein FliK
MNVITIGFPFASPSPPTGTAEVATGFAGALDALVAGGIAPQTTPLASLLTPAGQAAAQPLAAATAPTLPVATNATARLPAVSDIATTPPASDKPPLAMAQLLATATPIVLGAGPRPLGATSPAGIAAPLGKAAPAVGDTPALAPDVPESDLAATPPAPLPTGPATMVTPATGVAPDAETDPASADAMVALPAVDLPIDAPPLPGIAHDIVSTPAKASRPARAAPDSGARPDEAAATTAVAPVPVAVPVAVPIAAPVQPPAADAAPRASGKLSPRLGGIDHRAAPQGDGTVAATSPGLQTDQSSITAAAPNGDAATGDGAGGQGDGAPHSHAATATTAAPASGQVAGAPTFTVAGLTPTAPTATAAPAAAATPAEPVVNARPGELGRTIGLEIARKVDAGEDTLRVRLNPAELGRVEVTLAFEDDGSLRATLRAESAHTLHLLRQDAPDLGRALDQAGVRADAQSLRFESRDGSAGGSGGQSSFQQQSRGGQQQFRDDPEPDVQAYRTLRGEGQVDMIA